MIIHLKPQIYRTKGSLKTKNKADPKNVKQTPVTFGYTNNSRQQQDHK